MHSLDPDHRDVEQIEVQYKLHLEANSCSANQQVSHILYNQKVHRCVHSSLIVVFEPNECSPYPPIVFLKYPF